VYIWHTETQSRRHKEEERERQRERARDLAAVDEFDGGFTEEEVDEIADLVGRDEVRFCTTSRYVLAHNSLTVPVGLLYQLYNRS